MPPQCMWENPIFECLDILVGILITVRLIGNFKEISADQMVSMSFPVHSFMTGFSMHLAAPARCMVLFSTKKVHVS